MDIETKNISVRKGLNNINNNNDDNSNYRYRNENPAQKMDSDNDNDHRGKNESAKSLQRPPARPITYFSCRMINTRSWNIRI